MSARFTGLRRTLADAWLARTPGERRALRLAAIVVVIALWVQLLWHATEEGQHLRQQVETLEYRKALALHLAAQIADSTEHKAAADGLPLPLPAMAGLTIQTSERRYRITGTVMFDTWVAWLGELQHGSRLVLASARIHQTKVPGQVEVDGELERVP